MITMLEEDKWKKMSKACEDKSLWGAFDTQIPYANHLGL